MDTFIKSFLSRNTLIMKKITLALILMISFGFIANAQKMVVIDVDYILENMTTYQKAQKQLDEIAATWRTEISEEHDKIKGLYNKYQAEQVLLSEEMKKQREDEIIAREKAVMDLQKRKFGPEGELFKKRQELVQPVQEKVYGVIEEYATQRGYDMVFDTNGSLIYVDPEHDKTDEILRRLK